MMMRKLWAGLLFAGIGCHASASEPTLVQTSLGPVQGQVSGGALRWLGIPYAEPPVGERRWQATVPHAPWTVPFIADRYGSVCIQKGGVYGPPPPGQPWGKANLETFDKLTGSEDCLTLNLWRPDTPEKNLPVIVFVHGGANVVGYSGDPIYDSAKLAQAADAVVVTFNYRLGIFGWFAHPALTQANPLGASGNFAQLDMIEVLRFVQANAAAFGGDAGNVTLMGQSAGAINLYSLMVSKEAAGLFHKVVPLSGMIGGANKKEEAYAAAAQFTALLAQQDNLAPTPAEALKLMTGKDAAWQRQYLLTRTPEQLLKLMDQRDALPEHLGSYGDDRVIPVDPEAVWKSGDYPQRPALVGMTRHEARLFMYGAYKMDARERFSLMLDSNPDGEPQVEATDVLKPWMLPFTGSWLYRAVTNAMTWFLSFGVDSSVEKLVSHTPQVFYYRFDWNQSPEPWRTLYGAAHAIDLPFVFGNYANNFFAMCFSRQNQPGREALSNAMMQSLAAFIRTGDPNNPALPVHWPAWTEAEEAQLIFDADDQQALIHLR